MAAAKSVTVIQPTLSPHLGITLTDNKRKRVAAYARVSTENDEQLSSFEAQTEYYTDYIKSNDAWEFAGIYTDEGISGTSTKKRDGFNKMIADALNSKIDLIVTKSVSRFARNTVDTLTNVRKLREKGVEVYFEKENIYTLDSKGELMITIMSSLAQEESRSISENVRWGQRKRFADGKVSLPYKQFLGYEKGKDGLPKIVEKEAGIIRLIYRLFLEGKTPSGIAKYLTNSGIPTPGGKKNWLATTVKSILKNEKYEGNAILQKGYTVDYLTKKKKKNNGEIAMYYVENSHPAIIPPEAYELVQEEFRRRESAGTYTSAINCFASRIVCGDCGGFYGRKVWHSGTEYACTIWQCNKKFRKKEFCTTPHLKEKVIKSAFTDAFNSIIENKDEILANYDDIIAKITDFSVQENEISKINEECAVVTAKVEKLVSDNARSAIDQQEYERRYKAGAAKYNKLQNRIHELNTEIELRKGKHKQMLVFIDEIRKRDKLLTDFDEGLWCAVLNTMTVKSEHDVVFQFKDGTELLWSLRDE